MRRTDQRVLAIVGSTATGKSDLAVALATQLDGEIVNADAMQFYRGMDIGTAKLSVPERRGIAHHQLDVLEVTQEASVAAYQSAARADLAGITARGRRPILVGGSGLYVRAALDRFEIPPTDPALRSALERQSADPVGAHRLRERLHALDPQAAARIEPGNLRRVIRALEVIELTGRPFSATLPAREFVIPTTIVALTLPTERLDERIERRTARMWQQGLLKEVKALRERGLEQGRTARAALGYAQALAQLRGELTEAEAIAATAAATRRFARRQVGWWRSDPRVNWLPADAPDLADQALAVVATGEDGGQ